MKRSMTLALTAAALAMIGGTAGHAACNQSHVNNKTWQLSANESKDGALIFCTFRTSGSGTIAATANAAVTAETANTSRSGSLLKTFSPR